jgi:hypothetical protein
MQPAPGPVEITLSMNLLDQARNLEGAAYLWHRWAVEQGRTKPDVDRFVAELLDGMRQGALLLVVAYIDGAPVGMCTLHLSYDSSMSRIRVMGERIYAVPECRDRSIFHALRDASEMFTWLCGAEEQVVSGPYGSHLIEAYKMYGFRPTDVILKREVKWV